MAGSKKSYYCKIGEEKMEMQQLLTDLDENKFSPHILGLKSIAASCKVVDESVLTRFVHAWIVAPHLEMHEA